MSNWVIVAIPAKDDPVWKHSSETVPHLTILSLGEHEPGPDDAMLLGYIEHAANIMLNRFYMNVDRRGPLGPKDADVLFFDKPSTRDSIVAFREALLKDTKVRQWFNSSDQFPEWTPHLTMGWPEKPSINNVDSDGDPRKFWGVNFDKIALWTGDYDGPEIDLKSYEYVEDSDGMVAAHGAHMDIETLRGSMDLTKTIPSDVPSIKMEDLQGIREYLGHHGMEIVALSGSIEVSDEDALQYGKKGMKWGVRHRRGPDGQVTAQRIPTDAKEAIELKTKVKEARGTHVLSNNDLEKLNRRINLENTYVRSSQEQRLLIRSHSKIKQLLDLGKTANDAAKFVQSDVGKALMESAGYGRTGGAHAKVPKKK